MISPKEAIARFSKKYEGLTITNAVDYNDDWYILTAVESPNETSYSNPYYAVSKKDGTIASFYPAAEIAQYFKAVRERSIDLKTIDREKSMDDDVVEHSFQELTDDFLKHYGTPGMHWRQQGPGKRWQSQAVYAQGRLNPDARVKGQNEVNAAKKRMAIQNETLPGVPSDLLRKRYPSQKLSDLNRLDGKPTFETRREINHPSNEKGNEAGRHYNCPNCATAFEMQERGYDVIARPAKNGSNVGDIESNFENGKLRSVSGQIDLSKLSDLYKNMQNTEKRYKNTSFNNVKKRIDNAIEARKAFDDYYTELNNRRSEAADNAIRSIQSQGKNARGIVVVGWAQYENPSRRTSLYHAFNYKNENGELKFYDTQSNHGGAIKGTPQMMPKKLSFRT